MTKLALAFVLSTAPTQGEPGGDVKRQTLLDESANLKINYAVGVSMGATAYRYSRMGMMMGLGFDVLAAPKNAKVGAKAGVEVAASVIDPAVPREITQSSANRRYMDQGYGGIVVGLVYNFNDFVYSHADVGFGYGLAGHHSNEPDDAYEGLAGYHYVKPALALGANVLDELKVGLEFAYFWGYGADALFDLGEDATLFDGNPHSGPSYNLKVAYAF